MCVRATERQPINDSALLWSALGSIAALPQEEAPIAERAPFFGLRAAGAVGSPLTPGDFVGVAPLPGSEAPLLVVGPKFPEMNFPAMFAACLADPVVAAHLDRTFFIWPERPWIGLPEQPAWFAPLLVLAYLRALHTLCTRHLRRGHVRRTETLQGRIKGRILIQDTLRVGTARGRPDRVVCAFNVIDEDCLENRILRAALEVGTVALLRLPQGAHAGAAHIRTCRTALAAVPVKHISPRDMLAARTTGAFRHYREPLRLALAVLRHFGVNPEHLDWQGANTPLVPPFVLCTYELFERYAEAVMRQSTPVLWAGYADEDRNLGSPPYRVRPDFLDPAAGAIIDCKYKSLPQTADRADAFQVIAYSQHCGVRRTLHPGGICHGPTVLRLIFPCVAQGNEAGALTLQDVDNNFAVQIERWKLSCPRT